MTPRRRTLVKLLVAMVLIAILLVYAKERVDFVYTGF